jgi:hypothetical protein
VSQNTVKSLISGKLKFILPKINHLKGIKIERIGYSNEPLPKLSKEEEHQKIVSYQQALLEKINNIK